MKLFSDSQWLLKCKTGVLPLSSFQYSWHRLTIHVTNKVKFGKQSDWANKWALSTRLRGFFDYLCRPPTGPENLTPDLKRSVCHIWSGLMCARESCWWTSEVCPLFRGRAGGLSHCISMIPWPLWSGFAPVPGCNSATTWMNDGRSLTYGVDVSLALIFSFAYNRERKNKLYYLEIYEHFTH